MFKEVERGKRDKLMQRARIVRIIGTVIAALVFLFAMGVLFYVIRHRR
jgi:hypothetical protein